MQVLELVVLFFIKHLVVDYFLQRPYQYRNKGIYGHPGGILHAFNHGITTSGLLLLYVDDNYHYAILAGLIDSFLHYHIDWLKIKISTIFNWTPTNSDYFWHLLGVDQFLHMLTYVWLIYLFVI